MGDLFTLGSNALLAHRAAIQVIGQNIANAQTPGYVRERPMLAAVPGALTGSVDGAGLGQGVMLVDVQRLGDELLQAQIERQQGRGGLLSGRREGLEQVEALFTDLQGSGISDALGGFFAAFTEVVADPAGSGVRSQALQRAEILTDTIRDRTSALDAMQGMIDTRVSNEVGELNRLVGELADLNSKIGGAFSTSTKADLQSLQDPLIERIAKLSGAEAIRYDDGTVDLVLGGSRLLQASDAHELVIDTGGDPSKPGRITFADGTDAAIGGEIAGLVFVRDDAIGSYTDALNTLTKTLADEVNAVHKQGVDLNGNAGGDFFTYGADAARSLTVAAGLRDHPDLLAAGRDGGSGDGSNALAIANIQEAKLYAGGSATAEEYYADIISGIGSDTAAAKELENASSVFTQSLQTQFQSQAGVSLDEEGVDLLRYQQAYQAAARVISTAVELMDTVLQIGR